MLNEEFIEPGDDNEGEDTYRLTPNGAHSAVEAVKLYTLGYSHDEIADFLDFPPNDGEYDREVAVRILVGMAELSGVLDIPEVVDYLSEGWEDEL